MKFDIPTLINTAMSAYKKGNLQMADVICHLLLDYDVRHSIVYEILGHISVQIRMYEMALHYFQFAIDVNSSCKSAIKWRAEVRRILDQERPEENSGDSYLLVKAWGYGFWADVDHVLGQLLLAEITGRIPVVHWATASLFNDGSTRNAFEIYFEPLSEFSIDDLISAEYSYFPPKWSADNLYDDGVNKSSGQYSRMSGLYYLNRLEDVLVSDFHTYVNDLKHWIPSRHPLHGQSCESIYRYLFAKYIKLNADINSKVKNFREKYLAKNDFLAVHVRGSDKQVETSSLATVNACYHETIAKYLQMEPTLSIFLLTDYEPALREYHARYPGKLVSTQCLRTDDHTGVHYKYQDDKVKNGIEVVKDAYLAAGCKYFIGNGKSNVSTSILHMKNWDKDHYTLLANNHLLYDPHYLLHDR